MTCYARGLAPVVTQCAVPDGLEFARGPGDEALARTSWFPQGDDLGWLDRALAQALAARRRRGSTLVANAALSRDLQPVRLI